MPMDIHEDYRIPNRLDQHRNSTWTRTEKIMKTSNALNKKKNIKSSKGKRWSIIEWQTYKKYTDFSPGIMKGRTSWADLIQALREQKCQPRLLYSTKLSITIHGETKMFHDKKKVYTIAFHKSSTTKDNRWKMPTQKGKLHSRKSKKVIFFHQTQDKITTQI